MKKDLEKLHISVLLEELVKSIKIFPEKQNIIVDATLGMWGHAREIIKKLKKWDIFVWFDADRRNLDMVKPVLEEEFRGKWVEIFFINDNFLHLKKRLEDLGIYSITWIYYDFGLSSLHVDESERGFSFKYDGPLDMRFDINTWKPASHIVNNYSESDLIDIFRNYGEELSATKIAKEIIRQRKIKKFTSTKDLVEAIERVSKFPKSKNRIFQALRIETNEELENIKISLKDAIEMTSSWWSIFAISFHSLEDRVVKHMFQKESRDCICSELLCVCHHTKQLKIMTKKPILPSEDEIKVNPRSRSAKARFALKI